MTNQNTLNRFLDKDYRDAYLDIFVRAGIAHQIQAIRDTLGLSQVDFGKLLGKTQSFVSHIEDSEYSGTIKTLLDIAKALNIGLEVRFRSYDYILDTDVSPDSFKVSDVYESYRACVASANTTKVASAGAYIITLSVGSTAMAVNTTPSIVAGAFAVYIGVAGAVEFEDKAKWSTRNPAYPHRFPVSGTLNSERYILT